MKIVVICGRAARQPWTSGGLVARVCRELARRGHEVHLRAQSVDDGEAFTTSCASVRAFGSFDQTATDWPMGFAAWARRQVRGVDRDASVSFSRVVSGEVWMPLEPSGSAWMSRTVGTLGLKSRAIALLRHHGFARAWASDLLRVFPDGPRIRRVVAIGAQSAGEASRLLHKARGVGERVVKIDAFSTIDPPTTAVRAALRTSTRALLNIDHGRVALAVLAPLPVGGRLDTLLGAAAELQARDRTRAPTMIVVAKDCVAMHGRVVRCGAERVCRIVPLTARLDAVLSSVDGLVLPAKCDRGVFESGGLSRGAADALRMGLPILAAGGASGYELARWRSPSQDSPGAVVDVPSVDAWIRALKLVLDPAWRDRASRAAGELGKDLGFDRFADDLAGVIEAAAGERRSDPEDEGSTWDALLPTG